MAQEQLKSRPAVEPTRPSPQSPGGKGATNRPAEPPEEDGAPRRSTSFPKFLRDVSIVAALLVAGMFAYHRHIVTREKLKDLELKSVDKLAKDDLESLRAAEAIFQEALTVDADDPRALSGLAETYFHEWRHGLDTRSQAEETLKKAIAKHSERPERYATQAYLEITSGKAADAERELKELLDSGAGSSKLLHAYGWALLEEGNYAEANRIVGQALQTEFSGVRYALTLADVAHRQGDERGAIRNLRKALESSMNPKHELALAWLAALISKNYGTVTEAAKAIQEVDARKDKVGPRALALLSWAEGELALALGNDARALEKADAAIGQLKDYPPFYDLKARALLAKNDYPNAIAVYEQASAMKPEYRGITRDLIALKSDHKDESALALIDAFQKSSPAPSPEFDIMRGEFQLKKGDVEAAKDAFTKAADVGDDPAILFGLAKVAFLEEKKKGSKADLERVANAFQSALERRPTYPEVHEYMAQISLWNFDIAGATNSFNEAEGQYKKLNRPRPAMIQFYDRAIEAFRAIDAKASKKDAEKAAADWKQKKDQYIANLGG